MTLQHQHWHRPVPGRRDTVALGFSLSLLSSHLFPDLACSDHALIVIDGSDKGLPILKRQASTLDVRCTKGGCSAQAFLTDTPSAKAVIFGYLSSHSSGPSSS
jgi:hypothetical protein